MLQSLQIKNFKSFKDTTLKFSPFTLMIGANASGKSNAIEAIQFVQWALTSFLDFSDFIQLNEIRLLKGNLSQKHQFKVAYQSINEYVYTCQAVQGDSELEILSERITKDNVIHLDDVTHLERSWYLALNKSIIEIQNKNAVPKNSILRKFKSDIEKSDFIQDIRNNFTYFLSSTCLLDSSPHLMRGYIAEHEEDLGKHGENLSAILYKLCKEKTNKTIILDCIRCLPEQNITDIDFVVTERGDVMLKLEEEFGKTKQNIYADFLSDGTLRVLAIIAFILSTQRNTLLILEEIDNGIHPSRMKEFLGKIKTLASERGIQILMTSHNPALLDAIPYENLEDVVCCYRDKEEGDSRLVRLGDLYQYSELVAQGSLGDLVTSGKVDKFVHDNRTPEEIKEGALKWLEEFRKERGQK